MVVPFILVVIVALDGCQYKTSARTSPVLTTFFFSYPHLLPLPFILPHLPSSLFIYIYTHNIHILQTYSSSSPLDTHRAISPSIHLALCIDNNSPRPLDNTTFPHMSITISSQYIHLIPIPSSSIYNKHEPLSRGSALRQHQPHTTLDLRPCSPTQVMSLVDRIAS